MFFFASAQKHSQVLESSIGRCQFCHDANFTVDLIQRREKWHIFGIIPIDETVERLAYCNRCGKIVKEAHYTLRSVNQEATFSDDKNVHVVESQLE